MDGVQVIKLITTILVTIGSGKIVNSIVANNVPITGPVTKVAVKVTAFAVGGMIAKETSAYTDKQIDEIVAILNGRKPVTLIHTS